MLARTKQRGWKINRGQFLKILGASWTSFVTDHFFHIALNKRKVRMLNLETFLQGLSGPGKFFWNNFPWNNSLFFFAVMGKVVNLNNYTKVIVYTHLILSSRGSLDSWSPFHIQQYTTYVERKISNNIELQKSRKFLLPQICQLGQSSCCWPVNKLAKNALWKVYRSYKLYKYCIYIYTDRLPPEDWGSSLMKQNCRE